MRSRFILYCLLASLGAVQAEPLNQGLELATSVSNAYGSRSIFTNPAALAYQTELNGAGLLSSVTFGFNQNENSGGSLGLSYGGLGFGFEDLPSDSGRFQRFHLAAGVPLGTQFFLGARYVFINPRKAPNFGSLDGGLQWRPSRYFAIGFMANALNQPHVSGQTEPIQLVAGATLRPVDSVELTLDADSYTNRFLTKVGAQGTVAVEIFRGVKIRAGYHTDYKFQVGLQWNIGNASFYGVAQPGNDRRAFVAGAQFAARPYPTAIEPPVVLKVKIDSSLSEEGVAGSWFAKEVPSFIEVLSQLERAERNPNVVAIALDLETFPLGLAAAQDLHQALTRLRNQGKSIDVFLRSGGVKEYLIASAGTRIHMEKSGELRLMGLRSEHYFVKGTLDKIGAEGEFLARGEYKSAPEMFTRKESSALNREETLSHLKDAETALLKLLTQSRGITKEKWIEIRKVALYSGEEALAAGLIDEVGSTTAEMEKIKEKRHVKTSLQEMSDRLALPDRVSVIAAEGDIMEKKIRLLSLGGHVSITPERMEKQLKRAVSDPRTKAIVLRVNSPGGEVLASDEIAALISSAKQKKPVIVSMGDVAASGGYFISAPADYIFAQPLSVTGSIGVFLGKFNLSGLFHKLDLHKEILSTGPFAGLYTEDRPWSAEERAIMVRRLNHYYEGFVSYVADKRRLTYQAAETAAKGRVWLGENALGLKLIDATGGYREAIQYAAKKVGLREDDYEVLPIEDDASLFSFFDGESLLAKSATREIAATLFSDSALRELFWLSRIRENPILYLAPGKLE